MKSTRSFAIVVCILFSCSLAGAGLAAAEPLIKPGDRVLFLGDSITHAGHYVSIVEATLRAAHPGTIPDLINLGLPSETCSGLSEPDHPWPRPDVHERLDRALAKVKPDVVFACYGMNDGIYYPLSAERFAAYRAGVDRLIEKVKATGAKLVLMTPPAFDPLPLKQQGKLLPAGAEKYAYFAIYEDYDSVLQEYAKWIMRQRQRVDLVIDLHTPVLDYVAERRQSNPNFTMSPDGVHVNEEGHRVLAAAILAALGYATKAPEASLLALVETRQRIRHAAWLSHVGHKRPGVAAGLPLEQAEAKAAELDRQIAELK